MEIKENFKNSLELINSDKFGASFLEKLTESCCIVLTGGAKPFDSIKENPNSVVSKELYAALLYIFAEFVRHNKDAEDFLNFLSSEIKCKPEKTKILIESYRKHFAQIRIALLNIGNHLPHITNVKWKIDHVVKSSLCGKNEGPLFRISLKTEKYDENEETSKIDFINFTCTSQELQDLVFKLKDTVRHCQKLTAEH